MLFYPSDAVVPTELRTDDLLLRMLRASDVGLDYDAVISSREILLLHSGGRWPREGFTLEENLADLQGHERDHHARTSFTYTVMNPTETLCLGCVYVNPLHRMLQRLGAGADLVTSIEDYAAVVTFWARQSHLAQDLDRRLLHLLLGWLADAWAFSNLTFMANSSQTRHLRIIEEAGLRRLYTVDADGEPHAFFIYGQSA